MKSKTPISDAYCEVLSERDPKTGKTRATVILEAMTKKAEKGHKKAKALLPRLRRVAEQAERGQLWPPADDHSNS